MSRAIMSGAPPGPVGAMMRTGRVGYVCAQESRDTAETAAAPAVRCRNRLRWGSFIACPLTCGGGLPDSVRFRAGEFGHLGPLLGLACEKFGEIGGRAGQWRATQLSNPRLHLRVG